MLARAIREDETGSTARQWPNLVLGTLGVLSGLKEFVRWTLPGDGLPFLFMVEETPLKLAALTVNGALYIFGGVLLLRFAFGAKLLNAPLLLFGLAMTVVNVLYFHAALV